MHECENKRHALTVSWGAGYPALDVNSMPQVILPGGKSQFCECGGEYARVEPCPPGEHECHPLAGHVERSDDHTANLIPTPEPDPDEEALKALRLRHWRLQQAHLIEELERRLQAATYGSELERVADELVLAEARLALKRA